MIKKVLFLCLFPLCLCFLWNIEVGMRAKNVVSTKKDFFATGNEQTPLPEHYALLQLTEAALPSACLNNNGSGARSFQSNFGRLSVLIRPLGSCGIFLRDGFRLNDRFSLYGIVRPHLYLCRLLI